VKEGNVTPSALSATKPPICSEATASILGVWHVLPTVLACYRVFMYLYFGQIKWR